MQPYRFCFSARRARRFVSFFRRFIAASPFAAAGALSLVLISCGGSEPGAAPTSKKEQPVVDPLDFEKEQALAAAKAADPEVEEFDPAFMQQMVYYVTPEEASLMLERYPEAAVLDLRPPAEYGKERIDGAMNIDFNNPKFEYNLISLTRAQRYLIYDTTGFYSNDALFFFKAHDFVYVYHLDGGLNAWKEAGKAVATE